jgi:hypothetical protein
MKNKGFSKTHWLITQLSLVALDHSIEAAFWNRALWFGKLALPGLRFVGTTYLETCYRIKIRTFNLNSGLGLGY